MAKERPILFSGPMVRAILEGRKTQTRRVLKGDALAWIDDAGFLPGFVGHHDNHLCPYGQPGDRLWVRETWFNDAIFGKPEPVYRADGSFDEQFERHRLGQVGPFKWIPSIHMPRWASRINLGVTGIRVERLQDITEEDAKAEGAFFTDYGRMCGHGGAWADVGDCLAPDKSHPQREGWSCVPNTSHEQCLGSARMAFANLWNRINGEAAWDLNPWVWVVQFKKVDGDPGKGEG